MPIFYLSLLGRAPEEVSGAGLASRDIVLRIRRLLALGGFCVGLLAGACGGSGGVVREPTGGGGTAGGTGGSGGSIAQPRLPQVVTLGGTFLAAPKVLPILYSSDAGGSDILAFLQELTTTSYWAQTTSEYGVGPLTVLPPITITDPPPQTITDATLESNLAANTSGVNPAWGAADPGTIYLFVLPMGTIEQDTEGACCTDYDGYHYQADVGTGTNVVTVPYALSCACHNFDGPRVTDLQERTVDMSHELVESATDPFPDSDPAYTQEDDADIVWTFVTDGEVADMCEFNDDANVVPPGSTYMVQRSWSNAAAARFDNPCVPVVTSAPYLNSFPQLGNISYDDGAGTISTRGIHVPLGQSKTIDVALLSAAAVPGPWSVAAYDYDDAIVGSAAGTTLGQDASSGSSGDTVHLTITPTSPDSVLGGEAFIIWSDYGKPGDPDFESQLTMGLVTN
jgi:hypothetical protein